MKTNKTVILLLISTILQFICLFLSSYLVDQSINYDYICSIGLLILLTNTLFLINIITTRIFSIFFLTIIILQLVHYILVGEYLTTETLMNIPCYTSINVYILLKAISTIILFYLFWLPNILYPKIQKNKFTVFFSILLISFMFYTKPIKSFFYALYESYDILSSNTFFDVAISKQFERLTIPQGISPINGKNNNIVLIFTEGTSRRAILPDITPNTFQLLEKSFCVDNYFNHTAPTYRGVRGQLISGYQLNGVRIHHRLKANPKLSEIPSLHKILEKHGYKTCFISSQPTQDDFNEMLLNMGFQKVIIDKETKRIKTDKEVYAQLFKTISEYESKKEKYLVCTYLQGTHVYYSDPDSIKYKDGSNSCLNKFYNQDYWFGNFLKNMEDNNYFNNTILVYTTDHSTYPTPDFNKSFNSKHKSFVDRVPLVFYKKDIVPQHFNANNKNSLSLTPTILNILGIENEKNYFLGNSLFAKDESIYQRLSMRKDTVVDTSEGEARTVTNPNDFDLLQNNERLYKEHSKEEEEKKYNKVQEILKKIQIYYNLFG